MKHQKHNMLTPDRARYLLPFQIALRTQQIAEHREATTERERDRASNRIAETQKAIGKLEEVIRKAEKAERKAQDG